MVSFCPTFEIQSQAKKIEISSDGPEEEICSEGKDFCFIFLVDRSGSMDGMPLAITVQALILFIQSLPVGSQYAILNFGSDCKFQKYDPGLLRFNRKLWDYNDKTTE